MSEFSRLIKNLKQDSTGFKKIKIALLGDSATQMFNKVIKAVGYQEKLNFEIYEADYGQIEQELFDPKSKLYSFKPDYVIILYSLQKLQNIFHKKDSKSKVNFADEFINNLSKINKSINNDLQCKLLINNFIETDNRVYGNFSNKIEYSFLYQVRKINFKMMDFAISNKNFNIADISYLSNFYSQNQIFNPKFYVTSDLAFSLDFFAEIAKCILDLIQAIDGQIKKCLILDLDNTLWGGIIGDDGVDKIQIGDFGTGKIFSEIQTWAKNLKERGVILAICSKNTYEVAIEPFEVHPDMVLKTDDISIFVANWENKADNIRYIQKVLNIGFDSMVFIDDNPAERSIVRENIHGITVPELPIDPADYLSTLSKLNLFETASISDNDKNRTKQYKTEAKRVALRDNFTDHNSFLSSLDMVAKYSELNSFNIPRVSQLSQRSNQFNLRTIRYSEEDLISISENKDYHAFSFSLDDKFGSNGIISAIILKKINNSFFIDTWIMSCRVLKRDLENLVLNFMVKLSLDNEIELLIGERIPTKKNELVKNHYKDLGFTRIEKKWVLKVENYKLKEHKIKQLNNEIRRNN